MSMFEATITSREQYDELFDNWPFWAILSPHAYDYGAFTQEGELICVPCALKRLDTGEAEQADIFTIEQPRSSGEYCEAHHDDFIDPFCKECGTEGDDFNQLATSVSGEQCMCRKCYLTGLIRGTLSAYDRGNYEPTRGLTR